MLSRVCCCFHGDEVELEVVLKKMDSNRAESEQRLEQQAALLNTRNSRIRKLEGLYVLTQHSHIMTLTITFPSCVTIQTTNKLFISASEIPPKM